MILIAYGTRPEIIKLFPLIRQLKRKGLPFKTLFTGQHLDLYEDVKDLIPHPDYKLNKIMNPPLHWPNRFVEFVAWWRK